MARKGARPKAAAEPSQEGWSLPPGGSLLRVARSFRFAWQGICHLTKTQPNWRLHLLVAILVGALAVGLRVPPAELALLALTIGFVLALEAINTALEAAVDATGLPPSAVAQRVKDSAAAGVLIAAVAAVAAGVLVLGPRLLAVRGF